MLWCLWKHRNRVVFDNSVSNPNLHAACINMAREYYYCVGKGQQLKRHIVTPICWRKPEQGWFKLNSDGASQGNPGKAGGGGLIWDHQGMWIKGYIRRIGVVSSFAAECWALRDGLLLAIQLGI